MGRKKITPAIVGELEEVIRDGMSYARFDVTVNGKYVGILYVNRDDDLVPTKVLFEPVTGWVIPVTMYGS